jgi:hypothetical protein
VYYSKLFGVTTSRGFDLGDETLQIENKLHFFPWLFQSHAQYRQYQSLR